MGALCSVIQPRGPIGAFFGGGLSHCLVSGLSEAYSVPEADQTNAVSPMGNAGVPEVMVNEGHDWSQCFAAHMQAYMAPLAAYSRLWTF